MKVTGIIEKAKDGYYSIYVEEKFDGFYLASYGKTPEEAIEDMKVTVEEIREELGEKMPDLEFEFKLAEE